MQFRCLCLKSIIIKLNQIILTVTNKSLSIGLKEKFDRAKLTEKKIYRF
jgi:hypothetical protein